MTNIRQALQNACGLKPLKSCRCQNVQRQAYITSLPRTLVVHVKKVNSLADKSFIDLHLSENLTFGLPTGSTDYKVVAMLLEKDKKYKCVVKKGEKIVDYTPRLHRNIADISEKHKNFDILESDEIILFYDQQVSVFQYGLEDMHEKPDIQHLKTMSIPNKKVLRKDIEAFEPVFINGTKVDRNFLFSLIDEKSWLKSDHINVYLKLLSYTLSFVHVVDCAWFGQRLVRDNNPEMINWTFHQTENRNFTWLLFDFIVIPINERNMHWTLALIDVRKKIIYYCDSYGKSRSAGYVTFQVWRYLCFESLKHVGQKLDSKQWKICIYSSAHEIPIQTDGWSCGVCLCCCQSYNFQ